LRLPSRASLHEHRAATQEWIAEFNRGRKGDDLAWVGLPTLVAMLQNRGLEPIAARPLEPERRRSLLERSHPAAVGGWHAAGDLLLLAQTENQRRVLIPIAERVGPVEPVPEVDPAPELDRDLAARAIELADDLVASARQASIELPAEPIVLYRTMLRAARALVACGTMLEALQPKGVVVATAHSNAPRALALAARRAGVLSAYVPHAPLIANLRLADLPVDVAALRGPLEVERYVAAGASRDGLVAIGNPAAPPPASVSARLDADGLPAFALPTDDEWALERLVDLVHAALGDRVIASPHPRADRERLAELLPAGWAVWDGATAELLASGVSALIQASSGAGLEALQLGIPLIDLRFPGTAPNYPYLADPLIPSVATADDLSAAVAAAVDAPPERRAALRGLAQGWVAAGGEEAAKAGAAALERSLAAERRDAPIWDSWNASARSAR
jgi:hypothetical protein